MPCYDPPTPLEIVGKKMPAVLCGLVRALGPEKVVEVVDWAQAGVTKEDFLEWWKLHSKEDQRNEFYEKINKITLINRDLRHIDPRDENLHEDYKLKIIEECQVNFEYFKFVIAIFKPNRPDWINAILKNKNA